MPISDAYVVQYLLQETRGHRGALQWQEKDAECFAAELHGVEIELSTIRWRSGPRIFLTLTSVPGQIDVSQPVNKGLFREKYNSVDDEQLAYLLKQLARAVTDQCSARARRTRESVDEIRESIFRRLIGAESNGRGD
jgi:hypothetical protein